jgi:hypothetical protein
MSHNLRKKKFQNCHFSQNLQYMLAILIVVQMPITSRSVKGTMYAYYVGSVMSPVDDYKFQVQCMRRHGSLSHADFVFPSADDISIFSRDDILTILSEPKITRGMHHFSDDFSRWLDIR